MVTLKTLQSIWSWT